MVHLRNGKYGLVEVKLGGDKLINEGAANLLTLAGKINTEKMKPNSSKITDGRRSASLQLNDAIR